jgi:iron complex transport system substrate-binding protein
VKPVLAVLAGTWLAVTAPLPVRAEVPRRIISTNMCVDQLLLDLARPDQIIGLSPYARDPLRSWAAEKAAGHPVLSGTAEEILVMKPDLVIAGRYDARTMRAFLKTKGVRIEEFDAALSIDETRQQIRDVGRIVGAEDRARSRIAAIDAALTRLAAVAATAKVRVLPLARRGWVSGKQSLITDLLGKAGLINAADELGIGLGGFTTLEAIVRLRPDALLVTRDDFLAEDQGSAMLLHPAIAGLFPPERRIFMPEKLTVCGGAMLAEAIDGLASQLDRLKPRP